MKLADYIRGCSDDALDALITKAVAERNHRRDQKAHEVKMSLNVGDLATLQDIKPKYMHGATVEITELKGTRAVVNIVQGRAFRGRATRGITVPYNCLRPIHAPSDASDLEV